MGLFEPHGRHRRRDGEAALSGRLAGIARHARPRGPVELLDHVRVTREGGVSGDFRGAIKPGGRGRRQVTIMSARGWSAALRDLGEPALDWSQRRVNLLADGVELPRQIGAVLRIGSGVALEVTGECTPCHRMEEIAPGLKAALTPDWRGGVLCRVLEAGVIAVGDPIEVSQ